MTQLCENDAIASSSAAVAEVAAQVGGVPGMVDDMYFLRHILDMKPSSDKNGSLEINTTPNSPPTPQRTRSRLLGHRQSMTGSTVPFQSQPPPQQQPLPSPYSSPPMSTSPNGFVLCHPGMKDVPMWLKTLRLHKYTNMFQDLTYDEMMQLDDRKLEIRKVTKGARKKILQSLAKLKERIPTLRSIDKVMDERSDLSIAITELRGIMATPICPYRPSIPGQGDIDGLDVRLETISEENLPGHIIHLSSRIHEILFDTFKYHELEDEYLLKLLQVYEKICSHESFTSKQKSVAFTWKKSLRKVAVERNLLPGNHNVGIGYAGFKRAGYAQHRMSTSTTRSSTTSPPESSCAISPPPMPQSFSAPPPSSSSTTVAGVSGPQLDYEKLCQHPTGAVLIKQLLELNLQIQNKDEQHQHTVKPQRRSGGTQTPPGVMSKERISISKSLSSPDNSRLNKPLSQEEKMAFIRTFNQDSTSNLPPTPPHWIPSDIPPSRYPRLPPQYLAYHPSSSASLPHPPMVPPIPSTSLSLDARRPCYSYQGRQSLSARMPSASSSSGFSSGGSDRSSGAGSPTHSYPIKWTLPPGSSSYPVEMCNNQNMPPVK